MVDWKIAIRRASDFPDRAPELTEYRRRHRPADAAAGIDDHFQRSRQFRNVAREIIMIGRYDFIAFDLAAGFFAELAAFHLGPDLLNLLTEKRVLAEAQLEAVVLGGVVARGYLNAAVHVEMEKRKVKER